MTPPISSISNILSTINVKDFGAIGDNSHDDTQAFVDAFTYCNSLIRDGLVSTIKHPGITLLIPPATYNLQTLTSRIDVHCDVRDGGATIMVPEEYDSEVFRLGLSDATMQLAGASIDMPDVVKPIHSEIVSGSIGIRLCNLNASDIRLKRTFYFESGVWFGGEGEGFVYNDIWLGQMFYCTRALVLKPGSGGWCNSNNFYLGNIQQSAGYFGGSRVTDVRHVLMDGRSPATAIVGNKFYGLSMEGNASEYLVEAYNSYENTWYGPYHESGAPLNPVTISGDTCTSTDHGLIIGDMVTFQATSTPGGMFLATPYYVVAITDNTFKVSLDKGGTPVTFSSSGSSVTYILCNRMLFDSTGGLCYGNRFLDIFMPPSIEIDVIQNGTANANMINTSDRHSMVSYSPQDFPQYSSQNLSFSGGHRPGFAAYPPGVDPASKPTLWGAALGDRGLLFQQGFVSNTSGVLTYQRWADSTSYELASCRRSPTYISISGLNVTSGVPTTIDLTLTGASVGDYVLITPATDLPAGISIAWSRCSAADTVRVAFANATGSTISLTVNVNAIAIRRYY